MKKLFYIKTRTIFIFFPIIFCCTSIFSQSITTSSPDNNIVINFRLGTEGEPQYSVSAFGENFVLWSSLGLDFKDGGILEKNLKVINTSSHTTDETYTVIAGKSKYAQNYCN